MIADIPQRNAARRRPRHRHARQALRAGRFVPIAVATSRRKVLESTWDKTTINLPFGRCALPLWATRSAFRPDADTEALETYRKLVTFEAERDDGRGLSETWWMLPHERALGQNHAVGLSPDGRRRLSADRRLCRLARQPRQGRDVAAQGAIRQDPASPAAGPADLDACGKRGRDGLGRAPDRAHHVASQSTSC